MTRLWTILEERLFEKIKVMIAVEPPLVELLAKAFGAAGSTPMILTKEEEAFSALRVRQPVFFILSEEFGGNPSQPSPILDFIQNMPATQRRELFAVWVSSKVKSGDLFTAFSFSVNLVLAPDKLADVVHEIKKSWIHWRELYQVFIEARLQIIGP